jgi:membrane protein DedA with SNARE-associated domain
VNYAIGRSGRGARCIHLAQDRPALAALDQSDYIARAHAFFEKACGKAIVLTRFMPDRTDSSCRSLAAWRRCPTGAFSVLQHDGWSAWVALCLGAPVPVFGQRADSYKEQLSPWSPIGIRALVSLCRCWIESSVSRPRHMYTQVSHKRTTKA